VSRESGPFRVVHNLNGAVDPNFPFRGAVVVQSGAIGSTTNPPADALALVASANANNTAVYNLTQFPISNSLFTYFPDPSNSTTVIGTSAGNGIVSLVTTNGTRMQSGFISTPATPSMVARAGGGQPATAITTNVVNVTTVASNGDSVALPLAVAGLSITIYNNSTNTLSVWVANGSSDLIVASSDVGQTSFTMSFYTCIKSAPNGIWAVR
jgi:hypothetical protein